jgi:hypothetical protein
MRNKKEGTAADNFVVRQWSAGVRIHERVPEFETEPHSQSGNPPKSNDAANDDGRRRRAVRVRRFRSDRRSKNHRTVSYNIYHTTTTITNSNAVHQEINLGSLERDNRTIPVSMSSLAAATTTTATVVAAAKNSNDLNSRRRHPTPPPR